MEVEITKKDVIEFELRNAVSSLQRELEILRGNADEAIAAIEGNKLHRLAQFNPSNQGRIQRLIGEVQLRKELLDQI